MKRQLARRRWRIERTSKSATVLVAAQSLSGFGGIERVSEAICDAIRQDASLSLLPPWSTFARIEAQSDTKAGSIAGVLRRVRLTTRALGLAWTMIRSGADALIVTHERLMLPVAIGSLLSLGRPHVALIAHGREIWTRKSGIRSWAIRRATQVWCVSDFTARQVESSHRVAPSRIRRIHLPVGDRFFEVVPSLGERTPFILSVSRLDKSCRYKGVDVLLQAFALLEPLHGALELKIVGAGNDRAYYEDVLQDSPVSIRGRVTFLGSVSDEELYQLYSQALLFALPGRVTTDEEPGGEGFGIVFLEAGAAGLACIAGNAGGSAEAIQDGVTGLLVDGTSASEVANALAALVGDRDKCALMGQEARAWVRRVHSRESFAREVSSLMHQIALVPSGGAGYRTAPPGGAGLGDGVT